MKRYLNLILAVSLVFFLAGCSKYKYETVKGDPTQARIYTLDNGLKDTRHPLSAWILSAVPFS